jgi:drug/metabolite transporter (DMT)-like permease
LFKNASPRLLAILQALLVTFLWSTSWVLIKIGLEDIPALPFAGLRYFLAFLILLPLALQPSRRSTLRSLSKAQWGRLVVLGLVYYAITQGAQFLSLSYLPAVTVNLLLSMTSIPVAGLGFLLLGERPTPIQVAGIALAAMGAVVFFYPAAFASTEIIGLVVVACKRAIGHPGA